MELNILVVYLLITTHGIYVNENNKKIAYNGLYDTT